MLLNFIERGNGWPKTGDIIVDHEQETAYCVLADTHETGNIVTGDILRGQANECVLNVEKIDYEQYFETADWEV